VTDEKALTAVAAASGTWDVMILSAGYIETLASIRESSVDDWWQSFEVCTNPFTPAITRVSEGLGGSLRLVLITYHDRPMSRVP
jgi:hypothetical protein